MIAEPGTFDLLLGEFSRADCRRIFPKYASKVYQEKFKAVLNALEVIASPACTISAEEKAAYVQTRIDALPLLQKHELKGLRIRCGKIQLQVRQSGPMSQLYTHHLPLMQT